ncbi:MAG: MFS transporter [Stygiobacter sp. RIFOXYC12_FULL_38_8]|nr:MAG: MFS transporter [Stygiobacter sp. RIFOXYB2_FULL_37_11]OGV15300.1 MAG: MFS transporter [Stygiobacter sp. RIFOXYC2_FULL_38_25]OGV17889.1 MAG: MFS transporter [Stygiobacter sp. RIFOXYA2_FULL_38_8]OGV27259.1 MAG: MFS transporter [Stygiobacter sp. RIFOXYC12_FULL_38_8]OGV79038.1 MAG: MFS transporter [Stygiobacter sp. GWF2_38_21]
MDTAVHTKPEPSFAFRWIILVVISLAMFGNYYIYDSISPLADLLVKQLKFTDANIGLLQGIYSVPNILMVLIGGVIIDKFGTRISTFVFTLLCLLGSAVTFNPSLITGIFDSTTKMYLSYALLGILGISIINLISAYLQVHPQIKTVSKRFIIIILLLLVILPFCLPHEPIYGMASGRLIFGLGAESMIVAITTVIGRWFKGKQLSFAFGLNLTLARLGSFAALNSPSWASVFYDTYKYPLLIALGAGVISLAMAVIYWGMDSYAEKNYSLRPVPKQDEVRFSQIFSFSKSYWFVVLLCVTFYSGIFPFQTFAVKFFMDTHGTTRELGGFLSSTLTLSAMILTPLFGLLADYIGKRSLLMMIGSLLLVPVYLLMAYTQVSLYVPMAMMGLAFSLIPAVMWPSVAIIVDEAKLGTAYGLMTMIQNIGLAGFNFLIGWANDYSSGYTMGMWIFSSLGFFGLLFAYLLRKSEMSPTGHGLEKGIEKEVV